jgi:hypothetical protein
MHNNQLQRTAHGQHGAPPLNWVFGGPKAQVRWLDH